MNVFRKAVNEEVDAIDPVLRVARYCYRLLDQYGFSAEEYVDLDNAELYRYLETYTVDTVDPKYAFYFDSIPLNKEMLPVLESGYAALHLLEYDEDEDLNDVEQLTFRQEFHPLGAAILHGFGLEEISDPAEILMIEQGLCVLEERLWYNLVTNEHSHLHRYPESGMMDGIAHLLLGNATDE